MKSLCNCPNPYKIFYNSEINILEKFIIKIDENKRKRGREFEIKNLDNIKYNIQVNFRFFAKNYMQKMD